MAKKKTGSNAFSAVPAGLRARPGSKVTSGEILELIERIKKGDDMAYTVLAEKYSELTEAAAVNAHQKLKAIGGSAYGVDDLKQEAGVALYKAALTYDPEMQNKVTFGLYAKICTRNAMISLIRKESALTRRRNRAAEKEAAATHATFRLSDVSGAEEILRSGKKHLSEYELAVFSEYISGKTAREIAKDMGETPKSVSNAIYRIKVKLRRAAKEHTSIR